MTRPKQEETRLEKAARKEAGTFWALRDEAQKEIAASLISFAQKEKKRALREAADVVCDGDSHCSMQKGKILALAKENK